MFSNQSARSDAKQTRSRAKQTVCACVRFILTLIFTFSLGINAQPTTTNARLRGRVIDANGAGVAGAQITLQPTRGTHGTAHKLTIESDANGRFAFENLAAGAYRVTSAGEGFALASRELEIKNDEVNQVELSLTLENIAEQVVINGNRLMGYTENQERLPGSIEVLNKQTLEDARLFNFNEALRKFSGVNVREEEGFGLRPNIGIRGLNPTRSTKVLLLEDGIPLAYAPYGDNASYYHPPVDRYDSIEVLKGSAQILHGPVTVGGVINYLTPNPPAEQAGFVNLTGGTRDYLNAHAQYGNRFGSTGFVIDFSRKQGEGARDNVRSGLNDLSLKTVTTIGEQQALTIRFNHYRERSQLTYSGLTVSEYASNPRGNVFLNDRFYGDRVGASATHAFVFNNNLVFSTDFYGSHFKRHWWRQSSNSGQRPNRLNADADCRSIANLDTTCGNEGRLRSYYNFGIAPHLRASYSLFGGRSETDFGARYHFENQDRRQENGDTPNARTGTLIENNLRRTNAFSSFVQNRFTYGNFSVTPGVRVERIAYERVNRPLNANAIETHGTTNLTQLVPGIGFAYNVKRTTIFAGAHRGFAPPRAEDIITMQGGVVELDPELSWNYEIGFRSNPVRGLQLESTFFRLDYENQIVASSIAGGIGSTLTNGGASLHQGLEFSARADTGTMFNSPHNFYARTALTYLPIAEFRSVRYSSLALFVRGASNETLITGNRVPYAPKNMATVSFGYAHSDGFNSFLEAIYTGEQFADDINFTNPLADARLDTEAGRRLASTGQIGLVPASTIYNLTTNYDVESLRTTFFMTIKNLTNETVIVDRARGILPNSPRLVQAGLKYRF